MENRNFANAIAKELNLFAINTTIVRLLSAFLVVFCTLWSINSFGQSVSDAKIHRDAARLALRASGVVEDLRFQPINIQPTDQDRFFQVLKAIYNTPVGEDLRKCNIHTFPNPSIDYLVLVYNKSVEWSEPLENGIFDTESDEFNDLLYDYDLVIEKHVQWSNTQNAVTIRSRNALNMAALANEFYNIEGIEDVDLGIPKVAGNDIELTPNGNGWQVDFILRFGAQLTGQGKAHHWRFQVTPSYQVEFVKEFGEPVPSWMRCEAQQTLITRI